MISFHHPRHERVADASGDLSYANVRYSLDGYRIVRWQGDKVRTVQRWNGEGWLHVGRARSHAEARDMATEDQIARRAV